MRKVTQTLRVIRDAVGWAKLPEDIQSLLRAALKHAFPWGSFVLIAFQGWWREAPFGQVAVLSIMALVVLYCVVFALGVLRERGAFDRRTPHPEASQSPDAEITAKCRALKTLLGDALAEGRKLQRFMYPEGGELRIHGQREWDEWLAHTYNLIEDALNKGEAERFRGGREDRLEVRLKRLEELIPRIAPADINPNFDPQEYGRLQKANTELQSRVAALETRPRTEAEELKHDCLQLGTKLSQVTEQWIADYSEAERCEPTSLKIPDAQIEEELQNAKTEKEKQQVIFRLRQRRGFATLDQAEHEYDKSFRKRAVKLLELAEARGLVESHWKVEADTAGKDPWAMQRVAKELVRIGHGS